MAHINATNVVGYMIRERLVQLESLPALNDSHEAEISVITTLEHSRLKVWKHPAP